MITKKQSIPVRSERGRLGESIIWSQFNDVDFFIEDKFQEHFYFQILKKLFPDIRLNRIFPLGGKTKVISKAKKSTANKKKIFIVDNDFDDILTRKETLPNLFYLNRYSVENYLIELNSVKEIIREQFPAIKDREINEKFNINEFKSNCHSVFSELSALFLIISKYELGLPYLNFDPNSHVDYSTDPIVLKPNVLSNYRMTVENTLKHKSHRVKFSTQMRKAKIFFKKSNVLINALGKYIINLLMIWLKKKFRFSQCTLTSFCYRLAKNCSFQSLFYLRDAITLYIS